MRDEAHFTRERAFQHWSRGCRSCCAITKSQQVTENRIAHFRTAGDKIFFRTIILLSHFGRERVTVRMPSRAESERSRRDVCGDGSNSHSGLPRSGERLNGDWLHAGYRHPVASYELWRIVDRFCIFGFRFGDERPYAPFRELKQDDDRQGSFTALAKAAKQDYDRPRVKRAHTGQKES